MILVPKLIMHSLCKMFQRRRIICNSGITFRLKNNGKLLLRKYRIHAKEPAEVALIFIVTDHELPLLLIWPQYRKKSLNDRVTKVILTCA